MGWKFGEGDDPSEDNAEHDFENVGVGDFFWFRENNSDPYGFTRDITCDRIRQEVTVRISGNQRVPPFTAVTTAPIAVLADVLRKAGYKVTKPGLKRDDDGIDRMFAWRDAATDRYGDDLVGLLSAEFTTCGNNRRDKVPEEHEHALKAFRALSEEEQYKRIEAYVAKT